MLHYACDQFTDAETVRLAGCSCLIDDTDETTAVLEDAIDMASDILTIMSGFRVTGVCERTVRPIGSGSCMPVNDLTWSGAERFGGVGTIPLRGPNTNVLEITIDGEALAVDEYGLFDGEYLYRTEGGWPSHNDLRLDNLQLGTFQITYRFGFDADFVTRAAATELACELAAGFLGQPSLLPDGTVSANVQGVAVTIDRVTRNNPSALADTARFLSVYAPNGPNISGVWSPELTQGWNLVEVSSE